MKHIEKFNGKNLDELRPVIEQALQDAVGKYGLATSVGKITYGDTQFTAKLEVTTTNNGEVEFKKNADLLDLKPEWFGKTFEFRGTTYEIIGLDLSKRKFPVVIQDNNGKTSRFTADGIRELFGDAKAVEKKRRGNLRLHFEVHAHDYDLSQPLNTAWLGQEVRIGGETYKVIGADDRGRKLKIVIEASDGKLRVTPVEVFLSALKQKDNKHLLKMKAA